MGKALQSLMRGGFFKWGASFLSSGCTPWGQGIGFDGVRGFDKNHRMGECPPILHQNKALHTFHKRGQYRTARHRKGLE